MNKIISIVNLLFTRLGFNLVNASHTGHAMTFLLETDLTARRSLAPGENATRNRSAPKESGTGADFARSLAGTDTETPESDTQKPSAATAASEATRAAAVLIGQQSPEDVAAPTDTPEAEMPIDIKSDIVLEGKVSEGAEAEPILTDLTQADDADKALPAGNSAQTVAMSAAPVQSPNPAPVKTEASEPIAADGNTSALTRTAAPQDQPRPAQPEATAERPEAPEGHTEEAAPENAAATSNLTAVGVAQDKASKNTGPVASRSDTAGPATVPAPTSNKTQATPDGKAQKAEKHRADIPALEGDSTDTAALSALLAEQHSTSKLTNTHDQVSSADPSAAAMTAGTLPPSVSQSTAPVTPPAMAPTNALVVATPAEVVDILSDSVASPHEKKNHVHIQLDPPELGRVSLEFKFDSHGLQHVTIVGETPEAMRQLRLMHFELVNALERQGLSSENMSFQQHHTPQDSGQQTGRDANTPQRNVTGQTSRAIPELIVQNTIQSRPNSIAGLNIKL
ncbi:flagellar hook-length control protein FliK [Hyphomonas chukchiensis]|nr:flagellar hook-length control protein FliK [Hyphomonas chukchiensis]